MQISFPQFLKILDFQYFQLCSGCWFIILIWHKKHIGWFK